MQARAQRGGARLTAPPAPRARPAQHGTCWQECHCSDVGTCEHTSECVAFTCDDPKMRRRGSASECVADECTQVPRRRRHAPLGQGACLWARARPAMPAAHGGGPGRPARGRALRRALRAQARRASGAPASGRALV